MKWLEEYAAKSTVGVGQNGIRQIITTRACAELEATAALLRAGEGLADPLLVDNLNELPNPANDCLLLLSWSEARAQGAPLRRAIESDRQSSSVLVVANRPMSAAEHNELLMLGAVDVIDSGALEQADAKSLLDRAVARLASRSRLLRELENLRSLSFRDPLTGLWNRYFLEHELNRRFEDGRWNKLALIVFDVENFAQINEAFGSHGGDAVLRESARRLQAIGGTTVRAYRTGADEFVVMVEAYEHPSEVADLAASLLRNLQKPVEIESDSCDLALEAGIAFADDAGGSPTELLRAGELALRNSRRTSEGKLALFSPQMKSDAQEVALLERELKRAISGRELCLVYQPQVSGSDGAPVGVECLLRWRHPFRGLLSPDSFLQVAERAGLLQSITGFVVHTACAELGPLIQGTNLRLAINVGASDLQPDHQLIDHLLQTTLRAGLNPHQVEVEITEHALIEDLSATRTTLEAIRHIGMSVSLDDFGVGFSSLSYLRELPIAVLKIDRSFVQDLEHRHRDQQLLLGIIDLARRLGIETVSEGVETSEQRALLQRAGSDRLQGYLIAKPMPLDQLKRYLRENRLC